MAGGRPTLYTPEIVARICEGISEGKSLRTICRADDMPSIASVWLWKTKYPEFSEQYDTAERDRARLFVEDMIDIVENEPDVKRARMKFDAYKWMASKILPKYADKLAIGGAPDLPPVSMSNKLDVSDMSLEELEVLGTALEKALVRNP